MYALGQLHTGRLLALDDATRRIHLALVGGTGTGKSTLLANLMLDDLEAGRGFALIDPHGDLAEFIADHVPARRINDVIYFDPADPTHAVGFNPLSADIDHAVLAANIVSAFKHIWRDSWGPRMEYILSNAVRLLLATPGSTLVMLPLLLVDDGFRASLLARCTDPVIRLFWEVEYAGYSEKLRAEAIAPIQNKIGQFTANPAIRAIVGQHNAIDVPAIINGRKVLIANFSKKIGEEPSHLLGASLVTSLAIAAQARATIPEEKRQDFTLYVDEFQNFATDTFAAILSEMRKWRLNLALANQFMGQVPQLLRQSVIGNVGTLAVFRIGADDAPDLARHLRFGNPGELTATSNYQAWVKTMSEGTPTEPVHVTMLPLKQAQGGSLASVRRRTNARYARLRTEVERTIVKLFPTDDTLQPRRKQRRRTAKNTGIARQR